MEINPETHAPPVLLFAWGGFDFTCVLARASQRFTMFNADGVPVRARLQVTFNEFVDPEMEAEETKRETANYTKAYIVRQGETLSSIAAHTYKDPALWRPIARHNGIANPRELAVGQRLLIPQLPYQDPETGEVYQ
jgi:LysM repeat protein